MRSSCESDIKPAEMVNPERKRKAEAQSIQHISPVKPQTIKSSHTPNSFSSVPKRNPPSLFAPQPIVAIVITSSKNPLVRQNFNIHKNILCYYSQYFAAELDRSNISLEANPKPITLKDVQISTFGLFLNWIYYQKISNEEGKLPGLIELAKLWALGQRFESAALQNATMDHIRDEVQYPTEFESLIHFAYEMEGDGNELRRLVIARLAWTLPEPFKEIMERLPGHAQMDLILELKSQRDAVPKEYWRDIGHAKEFHVVENKSSSEETKD